MSSERDALEQAHGSALSALAQQHRVAYEVEPARVSSIGGRRTLRFLLSLYGSPVGLITDTSLGSPELQRIWRELQQVARAALPSQPAHTIISFEPFQPFIVYSRARAHRPEVVLTLSVALDSSDPAMTVAEYEAQCLAPIEQNLLRLGVRAQRWT